VTLGDLKVKLVESAPHKIRPARNIARPTLALKYFPFRVLGSAGGRWIGPTWQKAQLMPTRYA